MAHIHQSQVPDGMVANVPWGTPLNRWTDSMIERGVKHMDETDGEGFFPNLTRNLNEQADARGLTK